MANNSHSRMSDEKSYNNLLEKRFNLCNSFYRKSSCRSLHRLRAYIAPSLRLRCVIKCNFRFQNILGSSLLIIPRNSSWRLRDSLGSAYFISSFSLAKVIAIVFRFANSFSVFTIIQLCH